MKKKRNIPYYTGIVVFHNHKRALIFLIIESIIIQFLELLFSSVTNTEENDNPKCFLYLWSLCLSKLLIDPVFPIIVWPVACFLINRFPSSNPNVVLMCET